ncbi:MAG: GIY-YIG nuclease family protein [Anaerolineaceae bacterium]|nr:GIY-YIG nuclease family protein [Anaerolineaceae bacterium]
MTQDTVIYAFYEHQPEISISLILYNNMQETTRREFYLRNVSGHSDDELITQATHIMNVVAQEIHYLSGYGVDTGVIKVADKKVHQVTYPDFGTDIYSFRNGALIKFTPISYYAWMKGNGRNARIATHLREPADQTHIASMNSGASFRLPCVLMNEHARRQVSPAQQYFFGFYPRTGRKNKNKPYTLIYNKEDATFQRFIQRFYADGNLSFGDDRYFATQNSYVSIVSCKWPRPKAKPQKGPRRSILASQPSDNTEYVYIIRMGQTKHYKIGKSNDPQGRLMSLQTASPYKLKLLHTFRADNATAAEESLHAALHQTRMSGEWFKLTDQQKSALVSVSEYKNGYFLLGGELLKAEHLLNL